MQAGYRAARYALEQFFYSDDGVTDINGKPFFDLKNDGHKSADTVMAELGIPKAIWDEFKAEMKAQEKFFKAVLANPFLPGEGRHPSRPNVNEIKLKIMKATRTIRADQSQNFLNEPSFNEAIQSLRQAVNTPVTVASSISRTSRGGAASIERTVAILFPARMLSDCEKLKLLPMPVGIISHHDLYGVSDDIRNDDHDDIRGTEKANKAELLIFDWFPSEFDGDDTLFNVAYEFVAEIVKALNKINH